MKLEEGREPQESSGNITRTKEQISLLSRNILKLSDSLERSKIANYVNLMNKPWRLIYLNILGGIARGLGLAIGFTILGALLIYLLTRSFLLNLPIIGSFVGELVWIIQQYLRTRP